jgi:hypothetical protein
MLLRITGSIDGVTRIDLTVRLRECGHREGSAHLPAEEDFAIGLSGTLLAR